MKILTKKKVDEILKRITANDIIGIECVDDLEAHGQLVDNNMEIAYLVGGFKGMVKVASTIKKRYEK